jgi:hypothetical protein
MTLSGMRCTGVAKKSGNNRQGPIVPGHNVRGHIVPLQDASIYYILLSSVVAPLSRPSATNLDVRVCICSESSNTK